MMTFENIVHKPLKDYSTQEAKTYAQSILEKMTIKEKIGQLYQAPYFSNIVTGHAFDSTGTIDEIKAGLVGSVLSVHNEDTLFNLQKIAVEESRLGIPLIFMFDVIHGFKTAFPTNLALSNSWDTDLVERISKAVAFETSHAGIHLTFSPMVDLVRDPRWGRVMESNGEDPYLSSCLAKAYVRGYEQDSLSNKNAVAGCVKHFAGYGFAEAGREYNTVDISKRVFYNMVLPPFKAAVDEGVSMLMTSFNTIFDRPATANKELLKDILRDEMNFNGVVISDYTSTEEIIAHKVAIDEKDAALQCFNAGLEHEMVSRTYITHLESLVEERKVSEKDLDEAVLHMLILKVKLGLFDDPYRNFYPNSKQYMLLESTKNIAIEAVEKSVVMLKNDQVLPLKSNEKVALVGPYIDSKDVIGEWAALCKKDDVITIKDAFIQNNYPFEYFDDANIDDLKNYPEIKTVIIALGEPGSHAGEGNSKTKIYLDEKQKRLFNKVNRLNKKIVLTIFAGRPLIITDYANRADAVMYAYQPGTMTGTGLFNLYTGKSSPSGKLTMTFPYHEGQIPIYYNHYNTGRPLDPLRPNYRYNSRYIDAPNDPLYPFGFGLSYGTFIYTDLKLDKKELQKNQELKVEVTITNDSEYKAEEIVQLYIEAENFSVSRPVDELKAFKKEKFNPHEIKTITFTLTSNDFRAYNIDMNFTAEAHNYKVKVGSSSAKKIEEKVKVFD
jgi:beta-glucosidase